MARAGTDRSYKGVAVFPFRGRTTTVLRMDEDKFPNTDKSAESKMDFDKTVATDKPANTENSAEELNIDIEFDEKTENTFYESVAVLSKLDGVEERTENSF